MAETQGVTPSGWPNPPLPSSVDAGWRATAWQEVLRAAREQQDPLCALSTMGWRRQGVGGRAL